MFIVKAVNNCEMIMMITYCMLSAYQKAEPWIFFEICPKMYFRHFRGLTLQEGFQPLHTIMMMMMTNK
jgi:hypothetical protein